MDKLWACYIVYNNIDYLRASIESLIYYVDHIVLVDGKFSNYPGKYDHSTDGTVELIWEYKEKYPNKIHFVGGKEYSTEVQKRNVYVDLVPQNDWMWIIDGDELAYGFIKRVKPYLATHTEISVPVYFQSIIHMDPPKRHMRFVRKKEGMQYQGSHCALMYEGKNVIDYNLTRDINPIPIWLIHMGEMRNGGNTFNKNLYREQLITEEQPYEDVAFPGKFYCLIPGCENKGHQVQFAYRGQAFMISICTEHGYKFMQKPLLEIIDKYGQSTRNMKLKN